MPRRIILSVSLSIALSGLACGDRPPPGPVPVHPVGGRVTFRGKPLADALVVFHPVEAAAAPPAGPGIGGPPLPPRPTGKTDAEGHFKLHSYIGDDGAPIGEYKVTVVFAGSAETRNLMAKNSSDNPKVILPRKYADPAQSGLTAMVKDGDTVIPPFDLTDAQGTSKAKRPGE